MSINAIGTIGKKLIFRERKKIKDVKKYVIPKNPKSEGQNTQRGYLRTAIEAWKTDGFNRLDFEAWGRLASIQKKILSGINIYTSLRINQLKEGKTWTKITDYYLESVGEPWAYIEFKCASDKNGKLYLGTSPHVMLEEWSAGCAMGKYYITLLNLTKGTRYYFYVENTAENESARTGIYSFKTVIWD
ncbi:hypothetical protein ES708_14855 [subsurface metagenome]